MADEIDDLNETAFRIVEEATFGSPECPECGTRMERRERHQVEGKFGNDPALLRKTEVYFACPKCGYEAHIT